MYNFNCELDLQLTFQHHLVDTTSQHYFKIITQPLSVLLSSGIVIT